MMENAAMLRHQLLCMVVLSLAGCDATDPYLKARRMASERRQ